MPKKQTPVETKLNVGLYINSRSTNVLKLVRSLTAWGMSFRSVWREELAGLRPGDVDVLLLHGGWYGIDRMPAQDQHTRKATPENDAMAEAVREYVGAGGGIVGVCCGAFNVVWMGLVEADISRAAGAGPHILEVVDEKHPIVRPVLQRAKGRKDRRWNSIPVIRINGPILFPKRGARMLLSYDWEQRLGAVVAAEYGRGRAVAISPHPERTAHEIDGLTTLDEPLTQAAEILRAALYWSAGREVPPAAK